MKCVHFSLFTLLVLLASLCTANQDNIEAGIVNKNVERKVDLTTHLVKILTRVTVENSGQSTTKYYLFAVEATNRDRLSFIGAVTKVEDEETRLDVTQTTVKSEQKDAQFWRVTLPSPLGAGQAVTLDIETVYTHRLEPYPSQITQAEKQLVRYQGNLLFYSPYTTQTQSTSVTCSSTNLESYTQTKPVSKSESTITYGPHSNKKPFSQLELALHYENNSPFLTVTHLERVIEVSHWGNIAVEETLDMLHTGARLKGSFSRYEYQRNQDGISSIKSFKTVLPSSARDVYYRDEIGNISTSHLKELDDAVEVEIRPRFPLFGGWKSHYYIGYNVPSYQYLFSKGNKYALKMRFVDHVYDDQVIDEMTLKIILPEGCKVPEFKAPYNVRMGTSEKHLTYLDTVGRPVIIIHKSNLVEQHAQDFLVTYTFEKMHMVQEPLLIVGAFWLLFAAIIIYVRLDFSITKDASSESRMRVAGLIEQIQSMCMKRSALYQAYEDAINKFKSSKDSPSFVLSRKKADADYKSLTEQLKTIQAQLKSESADVADKVGQLNQLDAQYKEAIQTTILFAEKLVNGKLGKSQFVDEEAKLKTKKDDYLDKMDSILNML